MAKSYDIARIMTVDMDELNLAVNRQWTVELSPQKGVSFNQGDKHIWNIKAGWQTARIDEHGIYEDHKIFDNLESALKREWRENY